MTLTCTEYPGQPHRYSYWQLGFNDGYAGKHEQPPFNEGFYVPANNGYLNGYAAGREKFDRELMDKLRIAGERA